MKITIKETSYEGEEKTLTNVEHVVDRHEDDFVEVEFKDGSTEKFEDLHLDEVEGGMTLITEKELDNGVDREVLESVVAGFWQENDVNDSDPTYYVLHDNEGLHVSARRIVNNGLYDRWEIIGEDGEVVLSHDYSDY